MNQTMMKYHALTIMLSYMTLSQVYSVIREKTCYLFSHCYDLIQL